MFFLFIEYRFVLRGSVCVDVAAACALAIFFSFLCVSIAVGKVKIL